LERYITLLRNVEDLISEYKLNFYAERRRRGEVSEERELLRFNFINGQLATPQ
jgi:hypothetical protein